MWTDELKETARQMAMGGAGNTEIAAVVGKTPNAVGLFFNREKTHKTRTHKLGNVLTEVELSRAVSLREKRMSFLDIGKELHRDPDLVSRSLRALGYAPFQTVWTKEKEDELKTLYVSGISLKEIASIMGGGVTPSAVSNHLLVMGVSGRVLAKKPKTKRPREPTERNCFPRENGGWDSRVFAPYAEWKVWNQQRRAENAERV